MNRSRSIGIVGILAVAAGFLIGYSTAPRPGSAGMKSASAAHEPVANTPKARRPEDREDPPAMARQVITNLTSAAQLEHLYDTLLAWAARDPEAALAFALQNLKLRRREQAVGAILAEWTRHNPESAWNWTTNHSADNPQFIDAVLSQLGKSDGAKAWQLATAFASEHTNAARCTYVGALRGMTYSGNYETAAQLLSADKLLADEDRAAVASLLIASQWGLNDPEQAAVWARGLAEDDPIRLRVLAELGKAWAQVDPARAADYAVQLPVGSVRQEVMTRAIDCWIDQDPAGVGEWLNRLAANPDYDEAIKRLATHPNVAADAATALGWAGAITDRELRVQACTKIIHDWMQRDLPAATSYLQNTPDLSADLRKEIRGRIQNRDLYSSGEEK